MHALIYPTKACRLWLGMILKPPACDADVWPSYAGTLQSTWRAWRTTSARAWSPSHRLSARRQPTRSGLASLTRSTMCCDDVVAAPPVGAQGRIGVCTFFGWLGCAACFLRSMASAWCGGSCIPCRLGACLSRLLSSVQLHLCFTSAAGRCADCCEGRAHRPMGGGCERWCILTCYGCSATAVLSLQNAFEQTQ